MKTIAELKGIYGNPIQQDYRDFFGNLDTVEIDVEDVLELLAEKGQIVDGGTSRELDDLVSEIDFENAIDEVSDRMLDY